MTVFVCENYVEKSYECHTFGMCNIRIWLSVFHFLNSQQKSTFGAHVILYGN